MSDPNPIDGSRCADQVVFACEHAPGLRSRRFRVFQITTIVETEERTQSWEVATPGPIEQPDVEVDADGHAKDEVFEFLDNLRASGVVNMFGAAPYVQEEFEDLDKKEAGWYVGEWMRTFSERHSI